MEGNCHITLSHLSPTFTLLAYSRLLRDILPAVGSWLSISRQSRRLDPQVAATRDIRETRSSPRRRNAPASPRSCNESETPGPATRNSMSALGALRTNPLVRSRAQSGIETSAATRQEPRQKPPSSKLSRADLRNTKRQSGARSSVQPAGSNQACCIVVLR